jgi:hypothetical protein
MLCRCLHGHAPALRAPTPTSMHSCAAPIALRQMLVWLLCSTIIAVAICDGLLPGPGGARHSAGLVGWQCRITVTQPGCGSPITAGAHRARCMRHDVRVYEFDT